MSLHTQDPGFAVPGSHRTSQDTDSAVPFPTGLPRTSGARAKRIGSGPPDAWNKGIFLNTLVENKFVPTPLKPKLLSRENFPILPSLGIFPKGPIGGHGESYEGSPLDPGVQRGVRPRILYPPPLKTGTMEGTTMAATEIWKVVLERHNSYFDAANFEASAPCPMSMNSQQSLYTWQMPSGPADYPPHCAIIPLNARAPIFPGEQLIRTLVWWGAGWFVPKNIMDIISRFLPDADAPPLDGIFNAMRLLNTATLLGQVFPEEIIDWQNFNPDQGASLAEVEAHNRDLIKKKLGIYTEPNIGERTDWFTDAVFAQQHLTGANPCTLELASADWVERFRGEAEKQRKQRVLDVINEAIANGNELYIQDYSYFRTAIGVGNNETISSLPPKGMRRMNVMHPMKGGFVKVDSVEKTRYAVGSVCLFNLGKAGRLHPLAIIIDYKGSMDRSITIFNKRVRHDDGQLNVDQATDWPWRYAKNCIQMCDWVRHEIAVHLVNTHMMEESVIVGASRSFSTSHPVYKLLSPHWLKTLSLNAAARSILVPEVIIKISGMTPVQVMKLIGYEYNTFDWTGGYIPTDLARRGFPIDQINDEKFHNCAYARNMHVLWFIIRNFVARYLKATGKYPTDAEVASDKEIERWCQEMTATVPNAKGVGAKIKNFPSIKTRDELVDAVTMSIHLASPQHTAVNYLQEYYQTFVINKPPALYTPPPKNLADLEKYKEKDLMSALPVNLPREWLLAAHIPYLLNMTVASDQNLINYAKSVYSGIKNTPQSPKEGKDLEAAAEAFWNDLNLFSTVVDKFNKEMDNGTIDYLVLKPDVTAVSILI